MVMLIAFVLYAVILGIIYMASDTPQKVMLPAPIVVLVFALAFIFTSIFFSNHRNVVYPWSLVGGGIVALGVTFIVTAIYGGIQYINGNGFAGLGWEVPLYLLAGCIISSVVLVTYLNQR
ncbi:hypothetical protein DRN76_05260 [Methanosarcinales archaeon]|nr:MAG: hypothetical protein DRN76_05260 [Methanosarcinales archaeon]